VQNPTVTYSTAGTYNVTLTATNAGGSGVLTKTAYITVNVPVTVPEFIASSTNILQGGSVVFTDQSTNNPTSWSWSFPGGTPSTSTAKNPTVTYSTAGTYNVTLTATNAGGSGGVTKSAYITVLKSPVNNVVRLTSWVLGTNNPKVSGSNRVMVVMVMGESNANFSATNVSFGGRPMTKQTESILNVSGIRSYASIFTLNEIGVNAATSGTIAVSWSKTPSVGSSVCSVLLGNVDQTASVYTSANNALTGTSIATNALAAASGDLIIMAGATENNIVQIFNNGFTKEFESNTSWGDGVCGYKLGIGGNEIPSFTQSAIGRMVLCAIVVKKSSSSVFKTMDLSYSKDSQNSLRIYPNPASSILNIDFATAEISKEVKIFNEIGQLVYSLQTRNSSAQIDVQSIGVKGIVMVQVIEGDSVSTQMVIIK
jgi:PKD repeat protein